MFKGKFSENLGMVLKKAWENFKENSENAYWVNLKENFANFK